MKLISKKEAKNIPLADFLSLLGFEPDKTYIAQYMYKSPFRSGKKGQTERTASLSVSLKTNTFFDHGDPAFRGDIIDFMSFYRNIPLKEMPRILAEIQKVWTGVNQILLSPAMHKDYVKPIPTFKEEKTTSKLEIIRIKELFSYPLLNQLRERRISSDVARKYLKEVEYKTYAKQTKPFYAWGFANDSQGYELRNKVYKGCSKKDISSIVIHSQPDYVAIFEGHADFLSYLSAHPDHHFDGFIILNGAELWKRSITRLLEWQPRYVQLFLDNDEAGDRNTDIFLGRFKSTLKTAQARERQEAEAKAMMEKLAPLGVEFFDERHLYKKFKDYNEFICDS